MAGWHHRLNGHEFEQILGDSEGQGSLACCGPWGCKVPTTTQGLNSIFHTCGFIYLPPDGSIYWLFNFKGGTWYGKGLKYRRIRAQCRCFAMWQSQGVGDLVNIQKIIVLSSGSHSATLWQFPPALAGHGIYSVAWPDRGWVKRLLQFYRYLSSHKWDLMPG